MHSARLRSPLAANAHRPLLAAVCCALLAGCASRAPVAPTAPLAAPSAPVYVAAPKVDPRTAAAQDALSKMATLQDRLYLVAAPLLISNVELCKANARNLLGFTAKNKYSYPDIFADAAETVLGLGERLQVTGVLTGSGAARAGLRRGDLLVSADGKILPSGPDAETSAGAVFGPLMAKNTSVVLTALRGNATEQLTVPVTRACTFRVDLGNADNVNSYADGNRILVTRGMFGVIGSDQELAYVLAKGMAHNILGHAASTRATSALTRMIDNLVSVRPDLSLLIGSSGLKPMPQEADAAADQLALYLLARAGVGIEHASRFWQSVADKFPATVLNGYTANHPATATRIAAIEKTVADIKSKLALKKPLVP